MVESDKPQLKTQYGACTLPAGYFRLQTNSQNI